MNLVLTISTQDDADVDTVSHTGLTNEAYERLLSALGSAGFDVQAGPEQEA